MWKFIQRRVRDTCEKGFNQLEKRGSAGAVNANGPCEEKKQTCPPTPWFCRRACWRARRRFNHTNNDKKWNEHINRNWMGAITWSSALVLGWYAGQIINLAHKYKRKETFNKNSLNNLISKLCPYANVVNKEAVINNNAKIEHIISSFVPTVHLVSNDHSSQSTERTTSSCSVSNSDTSSSDLGDVLNSIENKLGLAAIENGQHQEGLNLLRSAANRRHAPALYNLGLCYEMGLGVTVDEKMAMELYRSAAALEHPGALYNLGIYYGQGRGGLQRNSDTATRLLRLAAIKGQEDAIEALKSLNIDIVEPPPRENKLWANDDILPTHSALFVDNVNYFKTQNGGTVVF